MDDRFWRLRFSRRIKKDPIFNREGEIAETWVESDDPQRIKRLVARGAYASDLPLRLSLVSSKRPHATINSVDCTAEAIAAWNTSLADLPDGRTPTADARSPLVTRLSVLRNVHVAVAAGVAAGMLSQEQADNVVLLVRDLLSQAR
jgi:hypothetical protein